MRFYFSALATAALLASPAAALKPPREESPAPRELVADVGSGNSDDALEQAIAAAAAHPLGTIANPVRVAGPEGARLYVARLRCADGSAPTLGAKRPGGIGAYGSLVDRHSLDCGAAAPGKVELILDIYHQEHVETRAPAGFTTAVR